MESSRFLRVFVLAFFFLCASFGLQAQSAKYIDDAEKWGVFDPERWDAFYGWLYENKLTAHDLRTMGYTNDYLS